MSKPITDTSITPLPFDQRLKLVQDEIKSRLTGKSTSERNAAQARMWVKWLERNVLEVSA